MDGIDRLDARIMKSLFADLAVEIENIKESVEALESDNLVAARVICEKIDIQLSSIDILLQNTEIE